MTEPIVVVALVTGVLGLIGSLASVWNSNQTNKRSTQVESRTAVVTEFEALLERQSDYIERLEQQVEKLSEELHGQRSQFREMEQHKLKADLTIYRLNAEIERLKQTNAKLREIIKNLGREESLDE